MSYYTTWGPIRGCCGHLHRTYETAVRCISRDHRGCVKQGGYTDRMLRVVDSREEIDAYDVTRGAGRELTDMSEEAAR